MPNHMNINFRNIASAAIKESGSWIPAAEVGSAVELIFADYEMSDNFSRSFNRISELYSVAAALSVFSFFLNTSEVMRLRSALVD